MIGTQWTPTGRVRISTRITTATETRTFEIRREELMVVHLDADANEAVSESEPPAQPALEFALLREELVVTKKIVPYERVAITTSRIQTEQPVDETLRKERVETDADRKRG